MPASIGFHALEIVEPHDAALVRHALFACTFMLYLFLVTLILMLCHYIAISFKAAGGSHTQNACGNDHSVAHNFLDFLCLQISVVDAVPDAQSHRPDLATPQLIKRNHDYLLKFVNVYADANQPEKLESGGKQSACPANVVLRPTCRHWWAGL